MNERGKGSADDASLLDIFANAVGMILILIVVATLAKLGGNGSKSQERVSSVVMSRRISTVMSQQRIPARAAMLHDYEACDRKRAADPSLVPLIALQQDFVVIEATGDKLNRSALLRDENALDEYLSTLSAEQKARFRCDIYAVDLYYLALSVLIEHGIFKVQDFHFIGSDDSQGPTPPIAQPAVTELLQPQDSAPPRAIETEPRAAPELPANVVIMARESADDWAPPPKAPPRSAEASERSNSSSPAQSKGSSLADLKQPASADRGAGPAASNLASTASKNPSETEGRSGQANPRGKRESSDTPASPGFSESAGAGLGAERTPAQAVNTAPGAAGASHARQSASNSVSDLTKGVADRPVIDDSTDPDSVASDSVVLGSGGGSNPQYPRSYTNGLFWGGGVDPGLGSLTDDTNRQGVRDTVVIGAPTADLLLFGVAISAFRASVPSARMYSPPSAAFSPLGPSSFRLLDPRVVAEARKKLPRMQKFLRSELTPALGIDPHPRIVWRKSEDPAPSIHIRIGVPVQELTVDSPAGPAENAQQGTASLVLRPEPFALPGRRVIVRRNSWLQVNQNGSAASGGWTRISFSDAAGGKRDGYVWGTLESNQLTVATDINEVTIDGHSVPQPVRRKPRWGWMVACGATGLLVLRILLWRFP